MGRKKLFAADLFCGAGGTTTGLLQAADARGYDVEMLAVNHWETAVETHAANHPSANHLCASLDRIDPSKAIPGGRLDLLVASPECTHHSIARGGKPCDDQSRASAWHVLHWAERLRVESIIVENVREFAGWGPLGANGRPLKSRKGETFQAWLTALRSLGYRVDFRVLNAADYGDATTRQRLFILATRNHRGVRWPVPSHAKAGSAGLFAGDVAPWRPAREVIDWSIPGQSIFDRERPLAENTLRRIEEGLKRFGGPAAEPFLVLLKGTRERQLAASARSLDGPVPALCTKEHVGLCEPFVANLSHPRGNGAYVRPVSDPLYTVTTSKGGELALVEPFLLGQQSGGAPRSVSDPAPTVATRGAVALVEPFLVGFYGERPGQVPRSHDVDEPVPTIPASGGGKFGVVEPFIMNAAHGDNPAGSGRGNGGRVRSLEDPVFTVHAGGGANAVVEPFLVPYYGNGQSRSTSEPVPTVTTRDRFALVEAPGGPARLDIRFRMLRTHELAAAHSFPKDYRFSGNQGEVVKQIGNSVPVELAAALSGATIDGKVS